MPVSVRQFLLRRLGFWFPHPKGYYLEAAGVRQSFALSPDGERIAFTAKDTSGAFRVFLRDFSEPESRPVADGEGAYSVVWSPDGQSLLFTANGKLRRVGVNASVSQVVSDYIPYFSSAIPFGSGRLLVSNHRNSGVIPSSGGTPHAIEQWYSWAQLLPGGRDFLYTIDDPQLGSMRARIAATGGNEQGVEVVQADSRVQYTGSLRSDGGYLVYLRAGTLLAQPFDLAGRRVTGDPKAIASRVPSFGYTGAADFSVSARGVLAYQSYVSRSQFIWVDRTGKRLSAASPAGINASYVRLSPDGRWLATAVFDIERGVPEIWLYDTRTGAGRKAIFGPGISHLPVWSPDSRRLVYLWDHSWPRLALSSLDGTPDPEPLPDTGFMAPTDWSPDGRFILYNNSALPAITQRFPSDVFAIDMVRGRKVIPLLKTPFFEYDAVFSPDGKWLAFLSDESGKGRNLYAGARPRQRLLTSDRGTFSDIPPGSAMPALAQERQGTLLPGLRRTSVRRATRFSPGGSPRRAAGAAFHDRCRSPRHTSLGCLIRRFRRWQPLRDSVDDPGRELGHGGAARLGVAGGEVKVPRRLLRPPSMLRLVRTSGMLLISVGAPQQLPPGRAEAVRASAISETLPPSP